ncbi:MAG: methyl-accepting chemotaxis protein [Campylobacterota bacterium]|nr:methyl-accepting chemotaxis protein [Campylobacterota bacterium]
MLRHPKTYKLATMFSIMFSVAFIAISSGFYWYDYKTQKDTLDQNIHSKAESILDFAGALLESRNEKFFSGESMEIPQNIQNEVFERFTKISDGKVFYKEASNDPVTAANKAKPYESDLIDFFKNNRDVKQAERIVEDEGKSYYLMARPMISEERCIMCHPTWAPDNVIAIENVRIDMVDYEEALSSGIILTLITAFINIVMILLLTHYIFTHHVVSRIQKVLEVIFRVEKGQFVIDDLIKDEPIAKGSTQNEIDRLFRHLDRMVNTLRPVIKNVVDESKSMAFEASYGYVKIDQTHEHVRRQNEDLQHSQKSIQQVLNLNNEMGEKMQMLLEGSSRSIEHITTGQEVLNSNLKESEDASVAMEDTVRSISELRTFSNEISKTMEVIMDIADETNLIALNAAIEAARAGEHGRGFAVVAEKIRELAEVSLNNAQTIGSVLKKIHDHIDSVTKNAEQAKDVMGALGTSSQELNERFVDIKGSMTMTTDVLHVFQEQFHKETDELKSVGEALVSVQDSSQVLVVNANNSKDIMSILVEKSGELKSLADGFEVVLNNRAINRTIITPPIHAHIKNSAKNRELGVYLFDNSAEGISFYAAEDALSFNLKIGDHGVLDCDTPIDGLSQISYEIVYISDQVLEGVFFYGAKKL